jgi:hypothetical protein
VYKKLVNVNTVASAMRHASPLFKCALLGQLAEEVLQSRGTALHTDETEKELEFNDALPGVMEGEPVLKGRTV